MTMYLVFDKRTIQGRKTPIFDVSNKSGILLGSIRFYPAWRKYVFEPVGDTVFDAGCLNEIISFMQERQREWRDGLGK